MGMKQSETIYRQWLGEERLDPALRGELWDNDSADVLR